MRILQVVYSCFPGNYRGGIPKVVFELSRALSEIGHDVTVYSSNFNSFIPADVPEGNATTVDGVALRYFDAKMPRYCHCPEMLREMMDPDNRFDVIHSHNTFQAPNTYSRKAAALHGSGLFYHVHGSLDPVRLKHRFLKGVKKRLYTSLVEKRNLNAADGLFAFTEYEKNSLRDLGVVSPIHILPNGIPMPARDVPSRAGVLSNPWNIKEGQPVILYVGRFHPQKGLPLLLEAFERVFKKHPEAKLVLVGNNDSGNPHVQSLVKQSEELGLVGSVVWTGFLNDDQKRDFYENCTVFSHVSESEGMAMSVLEAMAHRLPVLVGPGCNMDEAVRDGAIIESQYDVESISRAILELVDNPVKGRSVAAKAEEYVSQKHSWLEVANNVAGFYKQAI